jgi:hypothetical protein
MSKAFDSGRDPPRRRGARPEKGETMTVQELIDRLHRCNPQAEVRAASADGEPIYIRGDWGNVVLAAYDESGRTIVGRLEPESTMTKEVAR